MSVASMVVVPVPVEVAIPPGVMMATVGVFDDQVRKVVRFCVVPSLKFPIAVKACAPPRWMVGLAGLTVIEVSVALLTTRVAVPTMPFR